MLERASTVPKLTTLEGGGEQSDQLFSEPQLFEPPDVRPCSLRRLINYHSDRERGFLAWVPCAERICIINEQLLSHQTATRRVAVCWIAGYRLFPGKGDFR